MCTGECVCFFCPRSIIRDRLCPYYMPNAAGGPKARPHYIIWMGALFVCCGNHSGNCLNCPELYQPGNIAHQIATYLECEDCALRSLAES
ncbi:uncharacterized protein P884DRAFT_189627 [Thermothelomyces heterothallicus CBS 202.75]|uniref:uncharacterized protein n=1 Tax=Thermothelomyces heterothallicus CBS 202.75 TaxID=1149848 RepID=UPI0037430700